MDEDTGAIVAVESSALSEAEAEDKLAIRPPEELAPEIAKLLDVIADRLKLETPHPSTAARVRGARTVPREFVLSMIAAAERRPDVKDFGGFDSAQARAVLQIADAYRLLAERTAMFQASLNYTIEALWADVVADAMQTFSIASIWSTRPEEPELAAEVENLRRQLGRRGMRKKKKKKAAKTGEDPE